MESFERAESTVVEFENAGLSLISLAPNVFSTSGFNPTRHAAPFTAISRYAKGKLFLITTPLRDGWAYRIDYPYYSWAETIVRQPVKRHDFSQLLIELNQHEREAKGIWKLDKSEMTSAIKFLSDDGTLGSSSLAPDDVAKVFQNQLARRSAPNLQVAVTQRAS